MSLHVMPFLILNLGAEMIFVLNSRLRAQAMPQKSSIDALNQLTEATFGASFLEELFRPQPMYATSSIQHVFTALSCCPSLRISTNSAQKLYDLVYMTVKYQVFTLRHPLELLEMTLNHLDGVRDLVPEVSRPHVAMAEARVVALAATLAVGDWASVRRSMLNFFSYRHVRVSVFLESHVQSSETGAFSISLDTCLSPSPACKPPGLVCVTGVSEMGTFGHPDALLTAPSHIPVGSWNPTSKGGRLTRNGFNMYAAVNPAAPLADPLARQTHEIPTSLMAKYHTAAETASTGATASALPPPPSSQPPTTTTTPAAYSVEEEPDHRLQQWQQAYEGEQNHLARLLGSMDRAHGAEQIQLDLFEDHTPNHLGASGGGDAALQAPLITAPPHAAVAAVPVARMTTSALQEQNRQLLGILHEFDDLKQSGGGHAASGKAGGDGATVGDLLDLMDDL